MKRSSQAKIVSSALGMPLRISELQFKDAKMFERYTAGARRVIFFSRYEVSECGGSSIEPEHLLLGLLREDKSLLSPFLLENISNDIIRRKIEERMTVREKIALYTEIPLSSESKNVLQYAAEEADSLSSKQIASSHLLLGLLREENSLAAKILREINIEYSAVRKEFEKDFRG